MEIVEDITIFCKIILSNHYTVQSKILRENIGLLILGIIHKNNSDNIRHEYLAILQPLFF